MVDGTFYGLCKIFIFSNFHKIFIKIFIEKRTKMVVFQVLYRQAGIPKLSFIALSWAKSPWIPHTGELLTLLARNGQYFKIEYDLASYYESFGKERVTLTVQWVIDNDSWSPRLWIPYTELFLPESRFNFQSWNGSKRRTLSYCLANNSIFIYYWRLGRINWWTSTVRLDLILYLLQ